MYEEYKKIAIERVRKQRNQALARYCRARLRNLSVGTHLGMVRSASESGKSSALIRYHFESVVAAALVQGLMGKEIWGELLVEAVHCMDEEAQNICAWRYFFFWCFERGGVYAERWDNARGVRLECCELAIGISVKDQYNHWSYLELVKKRQRVPWVTQHFERMPLYEKPIGFCSRHPAQDNPLFPIDPKGYLKGEKEDE